MSKGGEEQQTVSSSEPWKPLQGPLQQLISRATNLSGNSPQFFPGQTFVGALPAETEAYQRQLGFSDSVFGGTPNPDYGAMVGANADLLSGGGAGQLFSGIAPQMQRQLLEQFAGPNVQIGSYGQGGLDQMLSGTPDYSGVEGAMKAYADPLFDTLNEDILPGLMSRGVSLNNTTGETKELNRIVPRMMRDIGNQGAMLAEQERQRALGAQERGVGMSLNTDIARQGALDRYRGDVLGLSGFAGNLAGQDASAKAAGVSAFPSTFETGMTPGRVLGGYGQFQRGLSEAGLQDEMNRFNYGQNQPRNDAEWLLSMLSGAGAGSGTTTQTTERDTNPFLSLLGTAATVGSFIPGPWMLPSRLAAGGVGAGMGVMPTAGGPMYA